LTELSDLSGRLSQFGEQQTAEYQVDAFLESQYGFLPYRETKGQIDGSAIGAGASVGSNQGELEISSGTNAGESVKVQSNQHLNYSPSKQAKCSLCFRRSSPGPTNSQILRWGLFTNDDGIFFEEDASAISYVVRKGGTDSTMASVDKAAVWTHDELELGNIDRTTAIVYTIEFSYYGANKVYWGIERSNSISPAQPYETHQLFKAYDPTKDSNLTGQYTNTASLPIRVEIDNDPNNSTDPSQSLSAFLGGRQLSLLGGRPDRGRNLTQRFTGISVANGSNEAALAIRPQEIFQGRPNGTNVAVKNIKVTETGGSNDVDVTCEVGSDITATWSDSSYSGSESSSEIATKSNISSATAGSGLQVPPRFLLSAGKKKEDTTKNTPVDQPLGPQQPFTIFTEGLGGSATVDIRIDWEETH
jgi:hypothetical protein